MASKTSFLIVGTIFLGIFKFTESSTADTGSENTPVLATKFKDAPDSKGQCVLPLVPPPDTSAKPEDGIRFGNTPHSRQEFSKDIEFMLSIMHDSIFALDFKTTAKSGVMFYVSAGWQRMDYIGLFMEDGKVVFVFDCGSGCAVISSNDTYNDGKWHHAVFLRHTQEGRLTIDDKEDVRGTSPGYYTRVDQQQSPLYVGGIPEELTGKARNSLHGISTSFPGCIRNVMAQGELLSRDDTLSVVKDTAGCSNSVEEGAFFSVEGGYIVLYDRHYIGQWTSISLDIKPRTPSGVLMAIHGKQDYLILQLIDGRVEFTVDNGAGPVTASYTPGGKHQLCDGQFHTIRVVKSNSTVTVTVDDRSSEPGTEMRGKSSTDTFNPFYVGGLPEMSLSERGVRTKDQFVGCMRNLQQNQIPLPMANSKVFGHVTLNTCPTA